MKTMYSLSFEQFLKLSQQGTVIPVYKEINADLDTPVSVFLKVKKSAYAFLLESVEGQEKIARYSFLGTNPLLVFKSKGRNIEITYPQRNTIRRYCTKEDPLTEIKKIMQDFHPVGVRGLPRFCGGLVGYIGYDVVRFFERLPDKNPDDLQLPDSCFMLSDTLLIFDHISHTIKIVSNCIVPNGKRAGVSRNRKAKIYKNAVKKIEALCRDISRPVADSLRKPLKRTIEIESNFQKSKFKEIVSRAKEYIKKGDIIQVVLSQRFKTEIEKKPFDIYRSLRSSNPSPYMFFLQLKDVVLVGSSPEIHVRCEEGVIQTRPIAGTRPRGKTEKEDLALEEELLRDTKEKAEHLMLVDLARNDVGRVAETGRVEVNEFMTVERYSHVMHLVSEVRGVLDRGFDIYDVLRATFPAGTVSGSPKIRAMEIIDELENVKRGAYAGCVGYFSFSGNMDTCITIRTIVVKDGTAYIQAGAGIVADSIPEKEYSESVHKAKALIEAISK